MTAIFFASAVDPAEIEYVVADHQKSMREVFTFAHPRLVSEEILTRFARLEKRTAVAGWQHHASVVPPSRWATARSICSQVAACAPNLSRPFPSPAVDGSVHVRWSTEDRGELILEIGEDTFDYTHVDRNGRVDVGQWPVTEDVAHLVVRKLA